MPVMEISAFRSWVLPARCPKVRFLPRHQAQQYFWRPLHLRQTCSKIPQQQQHPVKSPKSFSWSLCLIKHQSQTLSKKPELSGYCVFRTPYPINIRTLFRKMCPSSARDLHGNMPCSTSPYPSSNPAGTREAGNRLPLANLKRSRALTPEYSNTFICSLESCKGLGKHGCQPCSGWVLGGIKVRQRKHHNSGIASAGWVMNVVGFGTSTHTAPLVLVKPA